MTFTIPVGDWRDAVLGQNGATIALLIPQNKPGRPDNSGRVKQMKGTVAQELARDGGDPFKIEMVLQRRRHAAHRPQDEARRRRRDAGRLG